MAKTEEGDIVNVGRHIKQWTSPQRAHDKRRRTNNEDTKNARTKTKTLNNEGTPWNEWTMQTNTGSAKESEYEQ